MTARQLDFTTTGDTPRTLPRPTSSTNNNQLRGSISPTPRRPLRASSPPAPSTAPLKQPSASPRRRTTVINSNYRGLNINDDPRLKYQETNGFSFDEISRTFVGGAGLYVPQTMSLSDHELKKRHQDQENKRRTTALGLIATANLPKEVKDVLVMQCHEKWVLELVDMQDVLPHHVWLEWCHIAARNGKEYPFTIRRMLDPLPAN
eukprot:PhF_6_TR38751/c0_g1_i1/m.58021